MEREQKLRKVKIYPEDLKRGRIVKSMVRVFSTAISFMLLLAIFSLPSYGTLSTTQILIEDNNYSIPYVIKGNGSSENPYLIENVTLHVSGLPAILIENSNKHLVIRNVTVYSSGAFYAIEIKNSSNVTLEDVKVMQSDNFGLGLFNVKFLKVKGLSIKGSPLSIYFYKPEDMNNEFSGVYINGLKAEILRDLSNTKISGEYSFLGLYNCSNIVINAKISSEYVGIMLVRSRLLTLKVNVSADYYGIKGYSCEQILIQDSSFSRMGYNSIFFTNSSKINIRNVTAEEAFQGFMSISHSVDISVYGIYTSGSLGSVSYSRNVMIEKVSGAIGLGFQRCYNVTVKDTYFQNWNKNVLQIMECNDVKVVDSHFVNIRYMLGKFKQKPVDAVEVISSENITFLDDTFYNDWTGIAFFGSQDVKVERNYFGECTQGIVLKEWWTPNVNYVIKDCEFISSHVAALDVYSGYNLTIVHNLFKNNEGWALSLMNKGSTKIYLNTFVGNKEDVNEWTSHTYYNPELKKGNYWDKYHGTDQNHDGIGDTPYQVSNFSVDKYPLMKPTFTTQYTPPLPKQGLSYVQKFFIFVGIVVAASIALHYAHFRKKKGEE